ncbi:class I SAM-dependent DNA methyltransferase [Candidatus Contendibacter odensensis]|uniref:site-specific DNA-methyltransferase (adenine-specific) n=1 Tax=Candidatus Contendobacter odensis Run_B_J11 TaxID=1400861 RepID=A0A7U7GD38_9GAMM|nr:DNA methyltransferase [Candidatus Contendobacter odensis]CDH46194.1 DNA methyltransferase [Candidatus Contendobacter odensis Run_B_J11]
MPLSWNEIKDRALAFSREWADAVSEDAEAKSFWDQFFTVFGVTRRRVAAFEAPIKKADGAGGFIDLLWKGVLLVEHKSRGKSLDRAFRQALDYFPGLKERDLPRYVLVSDFARFRLYDLDADQSHDIALAELYQHVRLFGFMAGYQTRSFGQEDPVNIAAAEKLGRLHDGLKAAGYDGHPLEMLLVRLLFCLFAEDTAIFERQQFRDYLEARTGEDGADLGPQLAQLFQVLNTPPEQRFRTLDEQLAAFPHVNGRLFAEPLPLAAFNRVLRELLLDASALDWSRISPAIFGSLFQSILDPAARRHLGAHYTTETNILKALRPLLLDRLWTEFERVRRNARRLLEFQRQLAAVRVLDPACGCGNFLVVAYRELRLLELAVLRELHQTRSSDFLDVSQIVLVDVDQFYGIELAEFPAQIAQVALWLTDHQMNLRVSEEFGQYFIRLPLKKAPHIVHGNALTLDWRTLVKPADITVIVGNPPFVGAKFMSAVQRIEMATIFRDTRNAGLLDYVACWYRKAADVLADNPAIRVAFVSTNSITQGEQAGVLWPDLLQRGIQIHFAHRTFQWGSEARGKAAVHCVIVGFWRQDEPEKWLFDYETPKSEPHAIRVSNINPYLVDAPNVTLTNRQRPICDVPEIGIGNKPIDGGHYLFTTDEKALFLMKEPQAAPWFRRWLGADEVLNGYERWCLWLGHCPPDQLRKMPEAMKRVEAVRQFRLASQSAPTRKLADTPTRFHVENQPDSTYLVIPEVSSERRAFIPMGFMQTDTLCSNLVKIIPDATLYHFGVLSSTMHMAWVRAVCGRLESRYRYSAGIVYNNFPWPEPTDAQCQAIKTVAQAVLNARACFPNATLADLYHPLTMPPELLKTHRALDRAVDMAYGKTTFATEAERVAFLFERYRQLTSLLPAEGVKMTKRRKSAQ